MNLERKTRSKIMFVYSWDKVSLLLGHIGCRVLLILMDVN